MIPVSVLLIALVFGLCIGSFLNVCIHRLPESQSIVRPPSSCPKCGHRIRPYDNIPILSYFFLRGRCRRCGVRISVRYPAVELLTGLMAVATILRYGPTPAGLVVFAFIAALIVITFIDLDHRIIPDVISLPGIPLFFLGSLTLETVTPLESVFGILAGGGSLFLVAWGYHLLTGKEGMGGGDIKLLAMIGPMVGWTGILFTIFVSSATGTLIGLAVMIHSRGNMKLAIPFGPFLAFGATLYLFFGSEIIAWYWGFMRG